MHVHHYEKKSQVASLLYVIKLPFDGMLLLLERIFLSSEVCNLKTKTIHHLHELWDAIVVSTAGYTSKMICLGEKISLRILGFCNRSNSRVYLNSHACSALLWIN